MSESSLTVPSLWSSTLPNVGLYGALAILASIVTQFSNFDRARDYFTSAGGANSEEHFDFVIGKGLKSALTNKFMFDVGIQTMQFTDSIEILLYRLLFLQILKTFLVGAGSAGSVLANRLSRKFKVLVLEAGGQPNPLMGVPILAFPMESHPELDWTYFTVPQTNACLGLNGRVRPNFFKLFPERFSNGIQFISV